MIAGPLNCGAADEPDGGSEPWNYHVPLFLSRVTNLIRTRGGRVSHGQAPAQRARSPCAGLVEKTSGRVPVPWLCGAELPSGCRSAKRGACAAESHPAPCRGVAGGWLGTSVWAVPLLGRGQVRAFVGVAGDSDTG